MYDYSLIWWYYYTAEICQILVSFSVSWILCQSPVLNVDYTKPCSTHNLSLLLLFLLTFHIHFVVYLCPKRAVFTFQDPMRNNKCAVIEFCLPLSPHGWAMQVTTMPSYCSLIIWSDLSCLDIILWPSPLLVLTCLCFYYNLQHLWGWIYEPHGCFDYLRNINKYSTAVLFLSCHVLLYVMKGRFISHVWKGLKIPHPSI